MDKAKEIKYCFTVDCYDCGFELRILTYENIEGNICHCIKCGSENFSDFTKSEVINFKHYA